MFFLFVEKYLPVERSACSMAEILKERVRKRFFKTVRQTVSGNKGKKFCKKESLKRKVGNHRILGIDLVSSY